jgi:hypothetical protein
MVFNRAGQTDNNRSLTETSGPTRLIVGEVADGEYLMRDGTTIKGGPGGSEASVTTVTGEAPITVTESPATEFTVTHDNSGVDAGTWGTPSSLTINETGHVTSITADRFLAGEGLVYGEARPRRSISTLSGMLCTPDLNNRVLFVTGAASGLLLEVDPITKETYQIASYSAKVLTGINYSPNSGKLYIAYGSNLTMSVNATTGAIVTSGIAASGALGSALDPASGYLYGGNSSSGDIDMVDTTTDTDAGTISAVNTMNSNTRKGLTYCPTNTSIYFQRATGLSRIDCGTNTIAASFSCAALAGGSGAGSAVYSAWCDKVFACVGSCINLAQVDPGTDAQETSYPPPPGMTAGTGFNGMIAMGRYLYIGVNSASSPSEIMIFDCEEFEWVGCLNTLNGSVTAGNIMCGQIGAVGEDSFLYLLDGTTSNWTFFGGRI